MTHTEQARQLTRRAVVLGTATSVGLGLAAARAGATTWRTEPTGGAALAGLSWAAGPVPRARLRRRVAGRWSDWEALATCADGAPAGRRGTLPVWVGDADAVQVAIDGTAPAGLRLELVPDEAPLAWSPHVAHLFLAPAGPVPAPPVVSRAGWGADERLAWWTPQYTPTVGAVVVHHTVDANDYSRAQAAAVVRGVFRYHAKSLNWGDIGYNFLVDRFGTIYEGRKGGAADGVVAGHCYGFNHGTVGIGLLGTFDGTAPSAAMHASVTKLAAWILARYHRDPAGAALLTVDDDKNPRHPHPGQVVRAPVLGGHRDLYPTDCCGSRAYATIPSLRADAAHRMGPRVIDPSLHVAGAQLMLTGRTRDVHWAGVRLLDPSGNMVSDRKISLPATMRVPLALDQLPAGTSRLLVTPRGTGAHGGNPVEVDIVVPGDGTASCTLVGDRRPVVARW